MQLPGPSLRHAGVHVTRPEPFGHAEREPRCTAQKNETAELEHPGTTTLRSDFWLLFVLTTLRPEGRKLEMGQKL